MKGRGTHAGNATTRQLQRVISFNTSVQFIVERSINAPNVTTRQLQRVISFNTSEQFMKERSFPAENVTTRRLQMVILINTSMQFMKERSIFVRKGTDRSNLAKHIHSINLGRRFNCNLCSYEWTQKGNLKSHLDTVHHLKAALS